MKEVEEMGYAKQLLMEEQARLYHTSEDAVCPSCFHDSGIKAFIKANRECNECSVCGKVARRPIAANADRVLEFFLDKVHRYYQEPVLLQQYVDRLHRRHDCK